MRVRAREVVLEVNLDREQIANVERNYFHADLLDRDLDAALEVVSVSACLEACDQVRAI